MRKELKKLDGQREMFTAKFLREGLKRSYKGGSLPTVLLTDVRRISDGKVVSDHVWLNKTKAFAALNLSAGQEVQFAARVKEYTKGYQGRKEDVSKDVAQDFKLSHPTQVAVVDSKSLKETREGSKLIIRKKK